MLKALAGTLVFASYGIAQNCPSPPRFERQNDFFKWCTDVARGTPVPAPNGRPGDLICKCSAKSAAPISKEVARWVGIPALFAGAAGAVQAVSEASKSNEELISGASEGGDSKIGQAMLVGAGAGVVVAAVSFGVEKVGRFQVGPLGRDVPWWRRTRMMAGPGRRGTTRIGLQW